jgi:hypothetical protein
MISSAAKEKTEPSSVLAYESAIYASLKEALYKPVKHGVFRLELIYRDGVPIRFVTVYEDSHMLN